MMKIEIRNLYIEIYISKDLIDLIDKNEIKRYKKLKDIKNKKILFRKIKRGFNKWNYQKTG